MKIKTDFVTNSSTTCFIAWGVTVPQLKQGIAPHILKELQETRAVQLHKWNKHITFIPEKIELESLFGDGGIKEWEMDFNWVGIRLETLMMKYPDTRLCDIKKFVAHKMNKELGTHFDAKDISYIEEARYDG